MVQQNIVILAVKSIVVDTIGDLVYFPLWWYSKGFLHVVKHRTQSIDAMANQLALRLLVLNIFKPMFAQYDRAGRIISFFMRIVLLIARSIFFAVFSLLQILIIVLWVMIPILIFYRIICIYFSWYVAG